jgi:hypothetical protein
LENDRRPGGHRRRALAADLKPFDVCSIGWSMCAGSGLEAVGTERRPEVGAELLVTVKVRRHPADVRAQEKSQRDATVAWLAARFATCTFAALYQYKGRAPNLVGVLGRAPNVTQ